MKAVSVSAALLVAAAAAHAQQQPPQQAPAGRGELLYTTHCSACHSTQMHWRDQRRATDWSSLKAQVQQWQTTIGLRWSEADVLQVARYLNDKIYRFPQTSDQVSSLRPSVGSHTANRAILATSGQ